MSTTHHSLRSSHQADRFDWGAQVRLGMVLSIIAVIVTIGLAGRVPDRVLVIGLLLVASVLAWRRVPAVEPVRIRRQ